MPTRQVLILGLDAVPWSILRPMLDAGVMPRLKALCDSGCSGVLHSTIPHQTPSAWTTFMTGVQPGTHGILSWQHYDPRTQALGLNDTQRLTGRTIYRLLSDAGVKVGVVMQPATHPPFAVNGFLLSGFDSPGLDAPFAYPRELEAEILEICPAHAQNLEISEHWDSRDHATDDAAFERNMAAMNAYVGRVAALARELQRRHPADVLMVYFQAPDLVLHRAWRWCDPATAGESPRRREIVQGFFRALDKACADLLAATETPDRLTLVLSDHGQRADALRVRLNTILMEIGFLVPASGLNLVKDGVRRLARLARQDKARGLGLAIDWAKTRAFMPYQSCTGFIYINLEGRQPFGSVPPERLVAVREELIAALRAYRDPTTGANYFAEVAAMDAAGGWNPELDLPDLYAQPAAGVEFVRRAKRGEIVFPTRRPYAGLHDPDGIYLLQGAGVRRASEVPAHIADLAPTLLAALNVPVPAYMQGRVLNEAFDVPPPVARNPLAWDAGTGQGAYTAEQQAAVEERLANLGYLD